ncbi:hypothetical protein V6N13_008120 [Hibiscus sabdariffa]|uniref:Uncharacterized protein n=1 Tax=Hibiscus sabdariffa TaxID=183260 RepID=A0ABR2EC93_9ROSI
MVEHKEAKVENTITTAAQATTRQAAVVAGWLPHSRPIGYTHELTRTAVEQGSNEEPRGNVTLFLLAYFEFGSWAIVVDGNSVAGCLAKIGNNNEPHKQLFLTLPVAVLSLLQQAERIGMPPSVGIGV